MSKIKYKIEYNDIEKKILELEQMMDDSRFTKLILKSKNGWKFVISHSKRDKIFMETGKIQKFLPQTTSDIEGLPHD